MLLAVAYYAEWWDESRWEVDAQLMADAGIWGARLAEFTWCRLEPRDGCYDLCWLERVVAALARRGVNSILCTPTAAPPAWLCHEHPEIYAVAEDGRQRGFGHRRQYCPSNPVYRQYCRRLVTEMARRFADSDAVVGWQIDNELGEGNSGYCYCQTCRRGFQEYLREAFGTLETLNKTWGTIVWSQEYTDWDQIPVPGTAVYGRRHHNHALVLAYDRFMSQCWQSFLDEQLDILRTRNQNWVLTTNLLPFTNCRQLDCFTLGKALSKIGYSNYPPRPGEPFLSGMCLDLAGSILDTTFWPLEGPPAFSAIGGAPRPRPGFLRYTTYHTLAHRAEVMTFFSWRTPRFGCEETYGAVLPHDGRPGRIYEEVKAIGAELATLGVGAERDNPAAVAILVDYPSMWALGLVRATGEEDWWEEAYRYYAAFARAGVNVHLIGPDAALERYKVLILPMLYVCEQETAARFEQFVNAGGTLIGTHQCGWADGHGVIRDAAPPGPLATLFGLRVAEADVADPESESGNGVEMPGWGRTFECRLFFDLIEPDECQVLGRYTADFYAGTPAVTVRENGGRAYYVGATMDDGFYSQLVAELIERHDLPAVPGKPPELETVFARDAEGDLLFVMNGGKETQALDIPPGYRPILGAAPEARGLSLPRYGVAVLRKS